MPTRNEDHTALCNVYRTLRELTKELGLTNSVEPRYHSSYSVNNPPETASSRNLRNACQEEIDLIRREVKFSKLSRPIKKGGQKEPSD